jgi:hypothetical protein
MLVAGLVTPSFASRDAYLWLDQPTATIKAEATSQPPNTCTCGGCSIKPSETDDRYVPPEGAGPAFNDYLNF